MIAVRAFLLSLSLAMLAVSAHASVIIVGTRVIYPAGSRDVSVRLMNRGDRPALVQAWLDRGNAQSTPDTVSVPFALSPTLARIDPDRGQVLRLSYTGEPLAQDKESVFWLNVLEVPPKVSGADANNANILQFALRTRIKVFYRPKGLKDQPFDAARSVQWRLVQDGGAWKLEGRNASPYFVSVAEFSLRPDAQAPDAIATAEGGMVAPGETKSFTLGNIRPGLATAGQLVLRYTFIDDYGALVNEDANVSLSPSGTPAAATSQAR